MYYIFNNGRNFQYKNYNSKEWYTADIDIITPDVLKSESALLVYILQAEVYQLCNLTVFPINWI